MKLKIKEIESKSILSKSKVFDFVVNPYVGCAHACSYCYAKFMKRFTGHKEPWGDFVDVKVNAPQLLEKAVGGKKAKGRVWISGVCDPYQPLEKKYELTRKCVEILVKNDWPVIIQTRSPLVLRDLDLFKKAKKIEVCLSIGTANDKVRKAFEPKAPPIKERLEAIKTLHKNGAKTSVMIAPLLPDAEKLIALLAGHVDYVILDRMNYRHGAKIYKKHGWEEQATDEHFAEIKSKMMAQCAELGIDCQTAY